MGGWRAGHRGRRAAGAAGALGLLTVLLAACGSSPASSSATSPTPPAAPSTPTASPSSPAAPSTPSAPVDVSEAGWGHVHNLAYEGADLVLGTHEGLYRQSPGAAPALLSETRFDVMGLAHDGTRWLASGHPAVGEDLPADLGLRASPDGRSWTTVSLLGEVDFHRLAASGSTVLGVSAHDGALLRSSDGGEGWTRLDNPGAVDLSIDPGDPASVLATTESGPARSDDTGTTWTPVEGAPLLVFAAWTSTDVYGVAPDGTVHVSDDGGSSWRATGSVGGAPKAFAASTGRVAVLVGDAVVESIDGGRTFAPRLVGLDH
jgi:hypothetical protein